MLSTEAPCRKIGADSAPFTALRNWAYPWPSPSAIVRPSGVNSPTVNRTGFGVFTSGMLGGPMGFGRIERPVVTSTITVLVMLWSNSVVLSPPKRTA